MYDYIFMILKHVGTFFWKKSHTFFSGRCGKRQQQPCAAGALLRSTTATVEA
jgi:hypothetical protein